MEVLGYQVAIFVLVVVVAAIGGRKALFVATVMACIWTATHIFMPWLMILQYCTIAIAFVAGRGISKQKNKNSNSLSEIDDSISLRGKEVERLYRKRATKSQLTGIGSKAVQINCPHCQMPIEFRKGSKGRWVGTASGGGIGYVLFSGLGIAGGVLGAPVAIPATLIGVVIGAFVGNRAGSAIDNHKVRCPECRNKIVL